MGSYSGSKFSASHSTAIAAADPLIRFSLQHHEVSKISLGFIKSIRANGTNLHRYKFAIEKACIKVTVRGGISIQEIRLYTKDPSSLATDLEKHFRP
jgi:uncharacterized membrane protein